jgi:hypothetical protein
MRAIRLVSITLATMVLATTDAAAAPWCAFFLVRRWVAAKTVALRPSSNVRPRCWGWADGADSIHFPAQHLGPEALGGPVRCGSIGASIGN